MMMRFMILLPLMLTLTGCSDELVVSLKNGSDNRISNFTIYNKKQSHTISAVGMRSTIKIDMRDDTDIWISFISNGNKYNYSLGEFDETDSREVGLLIENNRIIVAMEYSSDNGQGISIGYIDINNE
jgi:hypothetical protein